MPGRAVDLVAVEPIGSDMNGASAGLAFIDRLALQLKLRLVRILRQKISEFIVFFNIQILSDCHNQHSS
jgi:hypothetical protein